MPDKSDNPFNFWEELKRRKVVRVVIVYAASAFAILEAADIIFPRLGLPDWTITAVLYILGFGFLLTIILSWIFDITPEGVERTLPATESQTEDTPISSNLWKIATYISFVVIIGLVTLNIIGGSKQLRAGDIHSIVVLPFENFTGDETLKFYVAGMHDGLIGDIQKISALRVISTTSSRTIKDSGMSIPEIASELEVEAAVESSLITHGEDSIRLRIKVIGIYPKEKQLWVSEYNVPKTQIINTISEITRKIAAEINIELTAEEKALLSEYKMIDPDAYEAYLKGQYYWEQLSVDSIQLALQYFELAIQKEPEWADPYVVLAQTWRFYGRLGLLPESVAKANKLRYLKKAIELNPESAKVHYGMANHAVWTDWDWELGEKEYIKTLKLNPNDALARLYYAHLLMILRRSDEAVQQANLGLALDPLRPLVLGLYGVVMTGEGNYQSAISAYDKARTIATDFGFAAVNILPNLYRCGDYEEWIRTWEIKVRPLWNDTAIESVVNVFYEKGHIAAVEEMFKMNEKYGSEGALMTNSIKAQRSMYLDDPEKAIDYLERMFVSEQNSLNITYIGTNLYFYDQLKTYPRYIELLKKLNLPIDDK